MSETLIADFIRSQPMWLGLLVVFVFMCLVDICWALYNRRSAFGKGFQAGLFSAGIVTFSLVSNAAVVANNYMLPAAVLAGFLATWVAVDWDHGRQKGPSVEERLDRLEASVFTNDREEASPMTREMARRASAREPIMELSLDDLRKSGPTLCPPKRRRACVPVPCPGCGMSSLDPGFVQEDHVPIRSQCLDRRGRSE